VTWLTVREEPPRKLQKAEARGRGQVHRKKRGLGGGECGSSTGHTHQEKTRTSDPAKRFEGEECGQSKEKEKIEKRKGGKKGKDRRVRKRLGPMCGKPVDKGSGNEGGKKACTGVQRHTRDPKPRGGEQKKVEEKQK